MSIDLGSYNTVAERIAEFRERHPEGCLRPVDPAKPFQVVEIGEQTFIAYSAAAYRTPDDPCPGIGVAWEPFPGPTRYTRDSELQNAETSAWGRAIVAVLAADTRKNGVASAEEVRNRQSDRDGGDHSRRPSPLSVSLFKQITEAADDRELRGYWQDVNRAGANGALSGPEVAQLKSHISRRREEMAAQQPGDRPYEGSPDDHPETDSVEAHA